MKTKRRTLYTYETRILSHDREGKSAELRWKPEYIQTILENIMKLDEKKRTEVKKDEWFFYLANYKISEDLIHTDYICGWFESVRIGFRTQLKRLSTMETRDNPKEPDESEIRRTYFYIRLSDGLFVLDTYKDNVVTANRISQYLGRFAKSIKTDPIIRNISFVNLINKGFLEELNKFTVIRLAQVRLKITPDITYNTNDAIGSLQEMSQTTYANYLDITLGRKHAKKRGLGVQELKSLLRKLMHNKEEVLSGTIEGAREDGGSPKLKLLGIEERYKKEFPVDSAGEVLSQQIFDYMIELGDSHYKVGQ